MYEVTIKENVINIVFIALSLVLYFAAVSTIKNKKEIFKLFFSEIKKAYSNLINSQGKIIKKFFKLFFAAIVVLIIMQSYIKAVNIVGQMCNLTVILLTLVFILFVIGCFYIIFGIPLMIINKISELILDIEDFEISSKFLISFFILFFCSVFSWSAHDKVYLQVLVFVGMAISYFLNIQILFRIVMDTLCMVKYKGEQLDVKSNRDKILRITLSGSVLLIVLIVINLFLCVLMMKYSYTGAYYSSITGYEIGIFDLFYYTIISFTTIGYGDIVPLGVGSQLMAIIIAFTSVICLGIFIGAALSVKDKLKAESDKNSNNVSEENLTEDINLIELEKIQKEMTQIIDPLKNSVSKDEEDRGSFKDIDLKYNLNTLIEGIDIKQLSNNKEFINDLKIHISKLKERNLRLSTENLENVELVNEFKNLVRKLEFIRKINLISEKISNISNETDLLSINAKIEATKAGEYGNTFSIVANEINKLSNNSKNISNEIQEVATYTTLSINNIEKNADNIIKRNENYNGYNEIFDEINKVGDDFLICCDLLDKYDKEYNNIIRVIENIISTINEHD